MVVLRQAVARNSPPDYCILNGSIPAPYLCSKKKRPSRRDGLFFLEQGTGIEPAFTAWEAVVLPIYEPCVGCIIAEPNGKCNHFLSNIHTTISNFRFVYAALPFFGGDREAVGEVIKSACVAKQSDKSQFIRVLSHPFRTYPIQTNYK